VARRVIAPTEFLHSTGKVFPVEFSHKIAKHKKTCRKGEMNKKQLWHHFKKNKK
jgi:hypothetical protein